MKVGFIGQGFIGKNMADDFENRGYEIVRYSLDTEYVENKSKIAECEVVFIAVPTPTTPDGFDMSTLKIVLKTVGSGNIAVIKSTVLPGSTTKLQNEFPDIVILHAPEFLREKSAALDTRNPERNIIGMAINDDKHKLAAETVMSILPKAPYAKICLSTESEIIKYAGNCFLAMKVIFMNHIYDATLSQCGDYEVVSEIIGADSRIGNGHMKVIDKSGHKGSVEGRGAGGHCFPKDLAAWRQWYEQINSQDVDGINFLHSLETKNNSLLRNSHKDLDLLKDIYGF